MHIVKLTGLALLLAVFYLGAGCSTVAEQESTFSYDKNEFAKAKPWTGKEFQNDPMQFQFAVIGDRTGGADAQGVFSRAIDHSTSSGTSSTAWWKSYKCLFSGPWVTTT